MKIKGKQPGQPKPEYIVIPRDGENLVFRADAVTDFTEFDKRCPEPKVPRVMKPGGISQLLHDDPDYQLKLETHNKQRTAWLLLQSLRNTPDLEWENVDYENPATWLYMEDEMQASGLTKAEIGAIITGIMTANSMNDERLREAREAFLRSQAAQPSV